MPIRITTRPVCAVDGTHTHAIVVSVKNYRLVLTTPGNIVCGLTDVTYAKSLGADVKDVLKRMRRLGMSPQGYIQPFRTDRSKWIIKLVLVTPDDNQPSTLHLVLLDPQLKGLHAYLTSSRTEALAHVSELMDQFAGQGNIDWTSVDEKEMILA
jgi:hypothetical protein